MVVSGLAVPLFGLINNRISVRAGTSLGLVQWLEGATLSHQESVWSSLTWFGKIWNFKLVTSLFGATLSQALDLLLWATNPYVHHLTESQRVLWISH